MLKPRLRWKERDMGRNIPRSRSAVRPQLERRPTPVSAQGPRSVVFLPFPHPPSPSSWTCRSLLTLLHQTAPPKPQPRLVLPDPGQFCPAMRGHLWEFIPDASCSLHPPLSVTPSASHPTHTQTHTFKPCIYMSLLSVSLCIFSRTC